MPDADADADAEITDETAPNEAPAALPPASPAHHKVLRRYGPVLWPAASLGFGLIAGPLTALAVNHGDPHPAVAAIVAAPLIVVAGFFVLAGVERMGWSWSAALWRVLVVLVAGSVVFLLPNGLNPPATGDFWWRTDLEKYAISCLPYPFVGWLVMPGIRRRLAAEVCLLMTAALALTWPALLRGMRAQTADTLRREIAVPPSMLYVLEMPGATTVGGYFSDGSAVSLSYRLPGSAHQAATDAPDLGYDLNIAVFPATKSSPCSQLPGILFDDDGFDRHGMSCGPTAAGLWRAADDGTFEVLDDVTEVRIVDGDYVALTLARPSREFDDAFPVLFAELRHPSDAELVAAGLDAAPGPLQ